MGHTLFLAACLLSGIPLGMLLKTDRESKMRGYRMPWLPFGSTSWPRLLLGIGVKILLIVPLFFVPLFFVSEVGRRFALCADLQVISFLYSTGILVGKGLRFAYWRRKDEWL
jgi:hypothetical protein